MRHHGRQPTKLPRPWDSPGKNTGVGCHCLLQSMQVKSESEVAQSCPTLSNPMDCSLPGSSIHGIFQARVLEWGAIAFSEKYLEDVLNQRLLILSQSFSFSRSRNLVDKPPSKWWGPNTLQVILMLLVEGSDLRNLNSLRLSFFNFLHFPCVLVRSSQLNSFFLFF